MTADFQMGWLLACAMLAAGCMTKSQAVSMRTGQGEALPVIEVKPGVAERLALMDAYRLHDETRKHMMRRPRVTVEELPLDEPLPAEAAPEQDAANEGADPEPAPRSSASSTCQSTPPNVDAASKRSCTSDM